MMQKPTVQRVVGTKKPGNLSGLLVKLLKGTSMNSQDNFSYEEPWNVPSIGQPLMALLSQSIETRDVVHPWLPAGLTLLAGKTKAGKSTFAE